MAYVAGKSIEVMRNGEPVRLKPGDPIPEAATWRNLKKELAWKRVIEVPDGTVKAAPPPAPLEEEHTPVLEDEDKPKKKKRKKKSKDKAPWED